MNTCHPGEIEVQKCAGVQAMAERGGRISDENIMFDFNSQTQAVDARDEQVYEDGHLPRAVSLSVDAAALDAASELPDLSQPVAVYGAQQGDEAARRVAQTLCALGYERVEVADWGWAEWRASRGEAAFGPARWNVVNLCAS